MEASNLRTLLAAVASGVVSIASSASAQSGWDADDELYRGRAWEEGPSPPGDARAGAIEARVLQRLDEARRDRDIIQVTCLNDKLTQIRAARRTLDARRLGTTEHDRRVAAQLVARIRELEQEADACIGQDVFEMGTTRVVTEIDPSARGGPDSVFRDDGRLAQASPPRQAPPLPTDEEPSGQPILVYRASLRLSVFAIAERQGQVLAIAEDLGGVLHEQTESYVIVRVPAPRFGEALTRMESVGQVLARHVQARDITEEYTDLRARLQNAEATRDRLLSLLERAGAVGDVLEVQRELERVTLLVEQLRGRLRFLDDRIAMSMIRVVFEPAQRDRVSDDFRVPVPWLDQLGLPALLDFARSDEWAEP